MSGQKEYQMDMKEMDRLTIERFKKPFKGSAGSLLEAITRGMSLDPTKSFKGIESVITEERRKKMLTKAIKMTVYDSNGNMINGAELTKITFNKDGSMAMIPSRLLREMMAEVEIGGAIFIEKIWAN